MVAWGGMVTSFEALEVLDAELCRTALSVGVLRLAMAEGLETLARRGGHHELGFASIEGYALERCERSARWVQSSRALARRLAQLPTIRRALVRGEIGFCMAQVIAGVARAEDEAQWVEEARQRTVREMRALVRDGTGPEPVFAAAADEPRVSLSVTVDREDGWLYEHARLLGKHAGTPEGEMMDALLAEGTTSLLAEMDRSLVVPFDGSPDERAPQRAWEHELARFRDEAEKRCEARIGERLRAMPRDTQARELTWNGDADSMDTQLRAVAAELARRDLVLGELAERFWNADGWRRLGFATESQYARERLGMSLSSVKAKRALARRGRDLPRLQTALNSQELGYEAARLVASVASRETVESWVERARERTVKYLREEVDAAQMLGRVGVDTTMAPPAVTTMDAIADLERRIVTGEVLQSGESQTFDYEAA